MEAQSLKEVVGFRLYIQITQQKGSKMQTLETTLILNYTRNGKHEKNMNNWLYKIIERHFQQSNLCFLNQIKIKQKGSKSCWVLLSVSLRNTCCPHIRLQQWLCSQHHLVKTECCSSLETDCTNE